MRGKLKDMDIKNCIYYFFHDMINIKRLDPNKLKTDEKSYKNKLSLHHWISYVQIF